MTPRQYLDGVYGNIKTIIYKGGSDITNQFNKMYKTSFCDLTYSVKNSLFDVAPTEFNVNDLSTIHTTQESVIYEPPDDKPITLGRNRYLLTEQFFQGRDSLITTVTNLPLFNESMTIYLTGGNSLLKGFHDRFKHTVERRRQGFSVMPIHNAITSSFVGCIKYAQLRHFKSQLLTSEEYVNKGMDKFL